MKSRVGWGRGVGRRDIQVNKTEMGNPARDPHFLEPGCPLDSPSFPLGKKSWGLRGELPQPVVSSLLAA